MHSLILGSINQDTEPLKTADEVIREIDDMMQDDSSIDGSPECNEVMEKAKEVLSSPLYEDSKLNNAYCLKFRKIHTGAKAEKILFRIKKHLLFFSFRFWIFPQIIYLYL